MRQPRKISGSSRLRSTNGLMPVGRCLSCHRTGGGLFWSLTSWIFRFAWDWFFVIRWLLVFPRFPTFFRLVCQGYPGAKGNFERSRREKWQDTYRHKIWKSRVCNLTNIVTGTLGWQKARDCLYWWSLHARTRYHQAGPWDANVWTTSTSSVAAGILN